MLFVFICFCDFVFGVYVMIGRVSINQSVMTDIVFGIGEWLSFVTGV